MRVPAFLSAAFALCFLASAEAAPESGSVTVAVGDVTVITEEGAAPVALQPGDKVEVGSTVRTGADSRAVVVITPRSAIRIAADSEVVIEVVEEGELPQKVLVEVKTGGLGALVKPSAVGEMDFRVRTPSGSAAARGTFFAVYVADGKGYAQVKEGLVEIQPEAEEDGNQ